MPNIHYIPYQPLIIMKALILVGGYGTRLRPLTVTCPKSVVPFINRPMVEFQIEALAKVGVSEVVLAINYQGSIIREDLKEIEDKYHIKITFVEEEHPLGTAGPIKLSEKILKEGNESGLVFVFNSDIICDFPLQELLLFHATHQKKASIVLATVQDPSRFGVVVTDESEKIVKFVEKPKEFISNKINAGIYLIHTSLIDEIPERFCMIEKEVFPQLAERSELYSLTLKNDFWFDLGKPQDYIYGQQSYLKYYNISPPQSLSLPPSTKIISNCQVDPSAHIGEHCQIGPNVVIGRNVKIGSGCRLRDCAIFRECKIGNGCFIQNSIVSWKCEMGDWVRVEGLSVMAEEVRVKEETRVTECMVLSHKAINESCEKQILM